MWLCPLKVGLESQYIQFFSDFEIYNSLEKEKSDKENDVINGEQSQLVGRSP